MTRQPGHHQRTLRGLAGGPPTDPPDLRHQRQDAQRFGLRTDHRSHSGDRRVRPHSSARVVVNYRLNDMKFVIANPEMEDRLFRVYCPNQHQTPIKTHTMICEKKWRVPIPPMNEMLNPVDVFISGLSTLSKEPL
jgi:hypothetical protein